MKKIRKIVTIILYCSFIFSIIGCVPSKSANMNDIEEIVIDYSTAEELEKELNAGIEPIGKTVQFTAGEIHEVEDLGFDIWAGEHLNFISDKDSGVEEGDSVTVKITEVQDYYGSWLLRYKLIEKVKGDPSVVKKKDEKLDLELIDSGWKLYDEGEREKISLYLWGTICNPNKEYCAKWVSLSYEIKDDSGCIIKKAGLGDCYLMPDDTAVMGTLIYFDKGEIEGDIQISFDVSCDKLVKADNEKYFSTSDFEIFDIILPDDGRPYPIKGKIKNNTNRDIEFMWLHVLYKKEGEVVCFSNGFLDDFEAGTTRQFEILGYVDVKDFDSIEVSVCFPDL